MQIKVFARYDNGMIVGCVTDAQSTFGQMPEQETRFFLEHDQAVAYMKDKCRQYCEREDVDFIHQTSDRMIVPANVMPKRRM